MQTHCSFCPRELYAGHETYCPYYAGENAVGTHTFQIVDWHPAPLNKLMAGFWKAYRLKKRDRRLVEGFAFLAKLPHAVCKRRVSLQITLAPRQRAADPDSFWKSLLDAMVHAGLLVDDSRQWVELGPVTFLRGQRRATTVTLEDLV